MEVPSYLHNLIQETVVCDNQRAHLLNTPHSIYKPKLYPDGDQWCALLGDDIQSGVAGFGKTPAEAMNAFDWAWDKPLVAVIDAEKGRE